MIPLSTRMRSQTLEEFSGQENFLYEGSLFYNSIKNKTFDSAIFFGPSGTGKTTLARLIAREMGGNFHELNASVTGTKELKELIDHVDPDFYQSIKNAILERAEKELPQKDQLILVYCRSGRRSKIAAQALAELGYTDVLEFGGILDWTGEIVTE